MECLKALSLLGCFVLAPPVTARQEHAVAPGDLAAVIASAQPGDSLRLLPGVHRGPLILAKSVHLFGDPGATLEGRGEGSVLIISADDVEVSGLTINGSGADLGSDDAVVLLHEVHRVAVTDCEIEARAFGIYLRAGGDHRIEANDIHGDPSLAIARRGNGIHLWNSSGNEIRSNRLLDVRDGVYLSFAHRNRIVGNEGRGLRYGIHYMFSERNTLQANRFERGTGGIALMFSLENWILDNHASDNERFGILCQQLERSHFEGNEVRRNGRGFYIENSAQNRFEGNHFLDNGVGAFLTAASEGNTFTGNRFAGNLVQVYEDHAGDNAWSAGGRGNEWSDYSGFDWDGDGIGETPYRLQTAASALLARRPEARWLWRSPFLALLDWWSTRPPAMVLTSFDPHPLVPTSMRRP